MYVGISQKLLGDVRSKLHQLANMERTAVNDAHGDTSKPEVQSTDWMFRFWWRTDDLYRMHVEGKFPPEMYVQSEMTVKILLKELHPDRQSASWYNPDMTVKVTGIPRHARIGKDGYVKDLGLYVSAGKDPAFQKHLEHRVALKECNDRWNKVESQVIQFLEHAKSLNEALKLWPDVARYVPQSYLDKVEEKVEKTKTASKAKELLANMDFETITSSTVIARMSSGQ